MFDPGASDFRCEIVTGVIFLHFGPLLGVPGASDSVHYRVVFTLTASSDLISVRNQLQGSTLQFDPRINFGANLVTGGVNTHR